MEAKWSSPIGGVLALMRMHQNAQKAGLRAAAYIVYNEVKRGLRGGYTSGDFVTGNVINSVTISQIFEPLPGTYGIRIGSNVAYALFWEVGHQNLFTRRFERVEIWRPALTNTLEQQRAAFSRAYVRSMLGQGAEPSGE